MERPDSFSPSEKHELIGRFLEEIKLRKYSYRTGRSYLLIVKIPQLWQNSERIFALLLR